MLRDCENAEMRDRLPDLMHGRLTEPERASVAAHVASCADCTAELALLERTRAELARAPKVDVGRIASVIPRAVPATARQYVPLHRRSSMRIAASIAFIVAAGSALAVALGREGVQTSTGGVTVGASPDTTPDGFGRSLFRTPEKVLLGAGPAKTPARSTNGSRGMSLGGGVGDLSEVEMESLLAALESFDGVPAAEPQAELEISGGSY